MKFNEKGQEKESEIFFNTPTKIAQTSLYYPIVSGISFCNNELYVKRKQYNSILIILVETGELVLEQDATYIGKQNDIILVDCYREHTYYCKNKAKTIWFHIKGCNSLYLFKKILKEQGHIIKNEILKVKLNELFVLIKKEENEFIISQKIYSILLLLLSNNNLEIKEKTKNIYIDKVNEFIKCNFSKQITIKNMAASINISPSYLFKIYKKNQLITPYEFLTQIRLAEAKTLLKQTTLSISDIAYKTGFNSDSNFVYFFKKETGTSPLKFRKFIF